MEQKSETIAFIGGGNMARSLIGGLIEGGWEPTAISVAEPVPDRRQDLIRQFGVCAVADNLEAAKGAKTVVVAVKPKVVSVVVAELSQALSRSCPLLISIAAGVRLSSIRKRLGADLPLVRAMPNTPALIGAGVSALYAGEEVELEDRARAEAIMQAVGATVWVPAEEQMDGVTALSGSGPAYFFLILEALEEAGVTEGLERETARILAVQTAQGAARLAEAENESPAQLRARVTSPGGTTTRGLAALEKGGLRIALLEAVWAASHRSRELGSS